MACVTAVVTAWVAAGPSAGAQTDSLRRPDLTGQWQLNPDLSEDAQEKLQNMGGSDGDAGRGSHGPGRHGGLGGIFGRIFGGGRDRAQFEEAHDLMLNAPTRFVLTQDDQKVVLTEPDGHVRTLPTDGRTVKIDGRDVRTRWENGRLMSEITLGNVRIFETYERSPSAQLLVTVRMDIEGHEVSVRRVYDPVTDDASLPQHMTLEEQPGSERGARLWLPVAGGALVGGALGFALGGGAGALIGGKVGATAGWKMRLLGRLFGRPNPPEADPVDAEVCSERDGDGGDEAHADGHPKGCHG